MTIQAQILELLQRLRASSGMAVILITHDLGVVAGIADRVNVMYAGYIVETAPVDEVFRDPRHPYTLGLLASIPRLDELARPRLTPIEGVPPDLIDLPPAARSSRAARTRSSGPSTRTRRSMPVGPAPLGGLLGGRARARRSTIPEPSARTRAIRAPQASPEAQRPTGAAGQPA